MRRALVSSFTAFHQPIRTTGASPVTSEGTYIATALDVLEKLLADARATTPLQIAPVELADVLMQLMATFKTSAPHHSLELALPGDNPTIMADEQTVIEVTRQLVTTAIALAPRGGCGACHFAHAGGRGADWRSSVRDNTHAKSNSANLSICFLPCLTWMQTDARRCSLCRLRGVRWQATAVESGLRRLPRAGGMTFYVWWPQTPTASTGAGRPLR